ncbi:TonB family protein [Croceicoccus sp. F390]|uniref:TonB family protein n=1 Tax=Croceicoccus esteveae TaxID=3075597 RepID=A0ABU2ZJM0_9SPHN|nr:TonB family protein [Croceicoccus sp. F390]MDT0576806.1 TonB family protein [Croceicoccus sp. F390]
MQDRSSSAAAPQRDRLRTRLGVAAVVLLLHVAAIAALLSAFDVVTIPGAGEALQSFSVSLDQPAPKPPQPPPPDELPPDELPPEPSVEPTAAAPPAPVAQPRDIAAPVPRLAPVPKNPVPPVRAEGTENRAGSAEDGTGRGGAGEGIGIGSGGAGAGGAGRGTPANSAQKIAGEIRAQDFPRSSASQRDGAFIIVHFTVGTDGRASNCRVIRSSGIAQVDRITCTLVQKRFRYRPATDREGRPVAQIVGWKQQWWQ